MFKRFFSAAAAIFLFATGALAAGPAELWLTAEDGVAVRGELYALEGDGAKSKPVVLLFHQAGSNAAEYSTIAPRLNTLGFNALAIDQRSGGKRWGVSNATVEKLGKSTTYLEALPDLEAALAWTEKSGYTGPTIVWGSSYSSALVFLLADKHGEQIDGVLSFSPGEYLDSGPGFVSRAAAKVKVPVIVLTPEDERGRAQPIFDAVKSEDKTFVIPERAVHGSSMLIVDRNAGAADVWPRVTTFLAQFGD